MPSSLASIHQAPCLPLRDFSLPPQPCFCTHNPFPATSSKKYQGGKNIAHCGWVKESGWCLWRLWSVSKGCIGGRRQSTGGLFGHSFITGGPSLEVLFPSMVWMHGGSSQLQSIFTRCNLYTRLAVMERYTAAPCLPSLFNIWAEKSLCCGRGMFAQDRCFNIVFWESQGRRSW